MSKFIKKFKYLIIALSLLLAISLYLIINKTLAADNDTYSREYLQKMIVAAAVSYYYNNYYADYEQYPLEYDVKYPYIKGNNDCVLNYKKSNNCTSNSNFYPLVSTTFFRNINITPEQVSASNRFNTDCTGFTYLVYNNVLGYNLSEFWKLSGTNTYTEIGNNNPQKIRVNESKINYDTAVERYGRSWNSTGNLTRIANCIAANEGERDKCKFKVLEDKELKSYNDKGTKATNYLDKDNKSELVYNYNFENINDVSSEWSEIQKYFDGSKTDFLMQPGDMLKISYESNGHVLIYVGDALRKGDTGFIHSTGNDNSWDDFGVRYEQSIYDYLNNKVEAKKKIVSIAIIRPINIYCNENTCTNKNIAKNNNNEARIAFSGTRVEQNIKKDTKYLTSHSSVDVGDTIIYSLNLEDKRGYGYCLDSSQSKSKCPEGSWIKDTGTVYDDEQNEPFYVKFTSPVGTTIKEYPKGYKCSGNENGTTTCEGSGYRYPKFTATINDKAASKLEPAKFEITYKKSTLTLNSINLKVNRTINSNDIKKLSNTIENFKNSNPTYSTSDKISNVDKINGTNEFSSLDFIKYIYYNNFNIDLSSLSGENIVNSLFYTWPPENTNFTQTLEGTKYTYTPTAFFKKTENNETNKMLVDQMYGGRKLIGNDDGNRIKYIHMGDFEIGDIIVFSNKLIDNFTHDRAGTAINYSLTTIKPNQDLKYYLVAGFDSTGYPTLVSFNANGIDSCAKESRTFDDKANNYILNNGGEYYCSSRIIKHLLYSSSLFAVLRPTQSQDYNNTSYTVTAYDGDNILKTVKDIKYNDKYEEKITDPNKKGYKFEGWYFDKELKNKATTVNLHTNHNIYANFELNKYNLTIDLNGAAYSGATSIEITSGETYTLPTIEREGYTFVKWELVGADSSINNNIFTMGTENATVKAIWKENNKLVFDKSLSVDADDNIIYNITPNTKIVSILNKIATNSTITIYDNNNNKIEKTEVAGTGYILSFNFNNTTINYTLVVKGDVTGDGNVSLLDLVTSFKETRNKTNNFNKYKKKAVDFNNNNILEDTDIVSHVKYYQNFK